MTGVTFKLYKEMRSIELIVIDDEELSLLFNGIVSEFSESRFCELYQAVKLVIQDDLESYSVFLENFGIKMDINKAILWLDSYDGDKSAKELSIFKFLDYLEAYRREWLKDFEEDLSLPIYNYEPLVEGIISDEY